MPPRDFTWIGGNNGNFGVAANWNQTNPAPQPGDPPDFPRFLEDHAHITGGYTGLRGFLQPGHVTFDGAIGLFQAFVWTTSEVNIKGAGLNLTGSSEIIANGAINIAAGTDIAISGGLLEARGSNIDLTTGSDLAVRDGATVRTFGSIVVARDGGGILDVQHGSVLESVGGYIGLNAGSGGIATLDLSSWRIDSNLVVGSQGGGDLYLLNGSSIYGTNAHGAVQNVEVGSASNPAINNYGNGFLGVYDESSLAAEFIVLGNQVGTEGWLVVDHTQPGYASGRLLAYTLLTVGADGIGHLDVENHARVIAANVNVAANAGSVSDLVVDHSDLIVANPAGGGFGWGVTGTLNIGLGGHADALFHDAFVIARRISVANNTNSTATWIIDPSTVAVDEDITVAFAGTATVTVEDSDVSAGRTTAIGVDGGHGYVTLDNSTWSSNAFVVGGGFGENGVGRLTIQNDSTVTVTGSAGSFGIGTHVGSDGTVVVAGDDSLLDVSQSADDVLTVGGSGVGRLTIQDHSLLRTQNASIGSFEGGTGTVTLDTSGWVAFTVYAGGAGDGTLNIQNASALATQGLLVATNATGHLNISGQSLVTAFYLQSAGAAGSEAWIDIGGVNTTLDVRQGDVQQGEQFIGIGAAGAAHLNVHDHATILTGRMHLADQVGGIADVMIDNSTVTVDHELWVASAGFANMTVRNNAVVTTTETTAGGDNSANANILVDHASWTANIFNVGNVGTANLTIQNEATVTITGTAGQFMVGVNSGGNGNVYLTGAGSLLDVSGSPDDLLVVGNSGNGTLTVDNGAVLRSQNAVVGSMTGSSGLVTIDGTAWTAADMIVGRVGQGTLIVENQGTVTAQYVAVGEDEGGLGNVFVNGGSAFNASSLLIAGGPGSQGAVDVGGLGSTLTVTGGPSPNVMVGNFGNANLIVHDQAVATVDSMWVANGGGISAVLVDDATLTVNQMLEIGISGNANFFVLNGGAVTAYGATMAGAPGSMAAVGVDASTLTVSQDFAVGLSGNANLYVANGGAVSANTMELGGQVVGFGGVTVDASTLTVSQNLTAGVLGHATIIVKNNGSLQVGNDLTLGQIGGSVASLNVDDAAANLMVGGFLNVGLSGQGTATFQNAAIADVNYLRIGRFSGSQGFVSVQGTGTHLTVDNILADPNTPVSGLAIGASGNGSMLITDHAAVDVVGGGFTNVGLGAGSNGSLTVSNSGVLNTQTFGVGGGTTPGGTGNVVVSSGGVINATYAGTTFASMRMYSGTVDVSQNGAIDLAGATTVTGAVHVGGSGSLVGAGTIIGNVVDDGVVRAVSSTSGNTLKISGNVTGTGQLFINPGAILELGGSDSLRVNFVHQANQPFDTLRLDQPGTFAGLIAGITGGTSAGDVIDLSGLTGVRAVINRVDATHASININTLAGQSYTYQTNGIATGLSFVNSSDGHGGTNITLMNVSTTVSATFGGVLLASDTGISASDFITRDGHVALSGTLSGNLNGIIVNVFDGATLLGRAAVNGPAGTWSLSADVTATQGVHSFSLSANNQGGGTAGASATQTLTVDTTAPGAPGAALHTDSGNPTDRITNAGQVDVTGLEGGASWQYSLDGGAFTGGTGTSLTVSGDGGHAVVVHQTDVAGNVSADASLSFTLDTAAPGTPGVALHTDSGNPTDRITNVGQVDVSGFEAGAAWQYSLDGGAFVSGTGTSLAVSGDGGHTVVVHQTDVAGNVSADASLSFTLDTAAPGAPGVALHTDSGNPTDRITNVGQVDVSGLEAGASWQYSLDGGAFTSGTGTGLTVSGNGAHTVVVHQTDVAGNVSGDASLSFTLDTAGPSAPSVALHTDSGNPTDRITNVGQVDVSGLEAGASWQYSLDGGAFTSGTGTGLTVSGNGAHTVLVHQTDAAGNVSGDASLSFTLDTAGPSAPSASLHTDSGNPTDRITNVGQVDVSGLEAGASWQYSLDGGAFTSGTGTGLTVSGNGAHTVLVHQTDAAGNVSADATLSFTLDAAGPSAPGVSLHADSGSSATDRITNSGQIDVSGLEAGAAWQYSLDGGAFTSGTGTSLTVSGNGAHTVLVHQTDVAGNVSGDASLSFTLDTAAPSAPAVALHTDSGSSATDRITNVGQVDVSGLELGAGWQYSLDGGSTWVGGTGTSLAVTGDGARNVLVHQTDVAGNVSANASLSFTLDSATPAVTASYAGGTISGSGDPGAVVHFAVDGSPIAATATANGSGAWSFTPTGLSSGPHTVVASETDAAGNVGSASVNFAGGGAPPAVAMILASDTGASATDRITNNPALTGTGEANAIVRFTVDGQAIAATAQANANGAWTFTPTGLADGTHTIVASETNAGGTSSASLTFTLDRAAPAKPTISGFTVDSGFTCTDHLTNDNTITLTGTGQAGTTIRVFDGANQVGTATVAANGKWSATTSVLSDGSHNFTATDIDVAGNVSQASSSFNVVVDTTDPVPIFTSLTQANGGSSVSLTGTTGEANDLILIFDSGCLVGVTTSGSNGSFSFNAGKVSNNDDHVYTAVAVDAAGNLGYSSNQAIVGSSNGDVLAGTSGNDFIIGSGGNDRITGGLGADTFTGNGGNDVYVYASIADSQPGAGHFDTITDFTHGNDDIDFRGIAGITANARLVTTPGQVAAHGISYYQSGSETIVIANVTGTANHVDIEIHLKGVIASHLSANDFLHI